MKSLLGPRPAEDIAREVNEISAELGPLLKRRSHIAAAMALTTMAAHHVLHDGEGRAAFTNLTEVAWAQSEQLHARCGKLEG